jgi:hypothetical protein
VFPEKKFSAVKKQWLSENWKNKYVVERRIVTLGSFSKLVGSFLPFNRKKDFGFSAGL